MPLARSISIVVCCLAAFATGLAAPAQTPTKPADKKPVVRPKTSATTKPAASQPASNAAPPVDPTWLEKLKPEDRGPLEDLRGYAPPAFGSDLNWLPEKQ